MSLFSNAIQPDSSIEEGTVVLVDHIRFLCKVRTLRGQVLPDVQWLLPSGGSNRGADRMTPSMGDRVVLNYGLGYPIIIGFLPKPQTGDGTFPLSIGSGSETVDTGAYGPSDVTYGDQNKPKDLVSGDRVISTIGGSMMALLRGGSAFIRANRGTEVFLSNFSNLVRIVSRNWAHFTDLSSDVIRNLSGRLYRYTGYSKDFTKAKNEDYNLHFYYGDVKAAETVKTGYDTYTGTPDSDDKIYKEQVSQRLPSPLELMKRTLNDRGEEEIVINNGTHITRVTSTAEQIEITWNNQNIITINETVIHAHHKDGADYVMDSAGIRATFSSGEINMETNDITATFGGSTAVMKTDEIILHTGGSTVDMKSGEITLTNGTGETKITPSETRMTNSGHVISITSGGIAVS